MADDPSLPHEVIRPGRRGPDAPPPPPNRVPPPAPPARRPALAPGEVPPPSTGWVPVVIGLAIAGVLAWQAWPYARRMLVKEERRVAPAPVVAAKKEAPAAERRSRTPIAAQPAGSWAASFGQARAALGGQRLGDAERLFGDALAAVEKEHGPDHPAAGLVLHQLALTYERQQRARDQEAALKRSLAVFDRTPPREAKVQLGALGNMVDKENVARYLGDMYWDQRRYADSFVYYQKAHAAALEVDVSPAARNVKRAYTAAGVMKTACMAGRWDLADETMAELKQRYPTVGPEVQRYLKYWIDTGEPRLKARRC